MRSNSIAFRRSTRRASHRRHLLLAALPVMAWAQPAAAQPVLMPVAATDAAEGDGGSVTVWGRVEDYRVSRTTSATRTDTPLVDVPQSVSVVTAKQIVDQAANSIGDAIRYTPGVFSAQGEGNRDTLLLRGNATTGDFFVDGTRDDVQTYRDLYNIDQLQVFKGPNAMIFGRGGIGGVVNRVTKAADGHGHRGLRLEAGSFDHYRGQLDLGAPLNDTASVRLTGVYQNSGSYRDGVDYQRWGLNPTATAAFGNTTVTAGYEHFQDDRVADRGVSSYLGVPLRTRRGQFFGDPANSLTWTNTDAATLFVEHRFSDALTIRNRTRYADYDKFYQNVFPGAVNTAAQANPAGLPAGVYAPGTIVQIQAYNQRTDRRNLINQTDLNARFATGTVEHTLLIGAEFARQKTANLRLEGFFPTATAPSGVQAIFARIDAPRIDRPDVQWRAIASSGANRGTTTVAAGYVQDQVALSRHFDVIVGVRYEHVRTRVTDLRTVGFPAGQQREFDVVDDLWSPRAGVIFKPVENASLYAAYSRTYLPRGGDQLTGLTIANQNLAPEKYQNYEFGAKWDLAAGLSLATALFRLDRSNVLALSDPNNPASPTVPIGRQRTEGVEVSATGTVTRGLSVVGAYTYSDARFRDSQSGTVLAGNRVPNVPRHAASLWTRYDPTASLGLGVGVIAQGKRYAATDNAVSMPGYARVDAALYYTMRPGLDLQLNVENVFNRRYYSYAHSNTNITPGSPTAVRVGLNARF